MKFFIPQSHRSQNMKRGFTLLETLIAVLIFSTSLTALMLITGRGITSGNNARDQIIAHYLAQEGIEFVRNVRDGNFIRSGVWDDGLGACVATSSNEGCKINFDFTELTSCGTSCGFIYRDNNGVYRSDSSIGTATGFTRVITVTPGGHSGELVVESQVTWDMFGIPRAVTIQTNLLQWR